MWLHYILPPYLCYIFYLFRSRSIFCALRKQIKIMFLVFVFFHRSCPDCSHIVLYLLNVVLTRCYIYYMFSLLRTRSFFFVANFKFLCTKENKLLSCFCFCFVCLFFHRSCPNCYSLWIPVLFVFIIYSLLVERWSPCL